MNTLNETRRVNPFDKFLEVTQRDNNLLKQNGRLVTKACAENRTLGPFASYLLKLKKNHDLIKKHGCRMCFIQLEHIDKIHVNCLDRNNEIFYAKNPLIKIKLKHRIAHAIILKTCRDWVRKEKPAKKKLIFSQFMSDSSLTKRLCDALRWNFKKSDCKSNKIKVYV